ncbi:hypothetical protein GCM10023205_71430 [Yinghuangia aomiensis]|uniref:Uncharacterized protein n=1 Tax=Yinghuangia aomiensis TaxID=676205 RepID=A0ABP9I6E7_9ACTN
MRIASGFAIGMGPGRGLGSSDTHSVDLDSTSLVAQPSGKGSDALFGTDVGPVVTLVVPRGERAEAIISPDGPEPTRDQCTESVTNRGSHTSGELSQGMRLCLVTDEGRTAYLRITSVPTLKTVTLEVTVWE